MKIQECRWPERDRHPIKPARPNPKRTECSDQPIQDAQIWGTPSQMIDRYRERVRVLGPITASLAVSYGGLPFEDAAESVRLIGTEVLPELKQL